MGFLDGAQKVTAFLKYANPAYSAIRLSEEVNDRITPPPFLRNFYPHNIAGRGLSVLQRGYQEVDERTGIPEEMRYANPALWARKAIPPVVNTIARGAGSIPYLDQAAKISPAYHAANRIPFDKLPTRPSEVPGAAFDAFVWAADAPMKYWSRPVLGFGAKHFGLDPKVALEDPEDLLKYGMFGAPIRFIKNARLNDEERERVNAADSYTGAYNATFEGHPVMEFLASVGYDPSTWASLGSGAIVKGGAKVAVTGATKTPALQRAVMGAARGVNTTSRLYDTALGAPLLGGIKAIEYPLKKTGLLDRTVKGEMVNAFRQIGTGTDQVLTGPTHRIGSSVLDSGTRAQLEDTAFSPLLRYIESDEAANVLHGDLLQRIFNQTEQIGTLNTSRAYDAMRVYESNTPVLPDRFTDLKDVVEFRLKRDGYLNQAGQETDKFLSHKLIDESDVARQTNPALQVQNHEALDSAARAAKANGGSEEEVYEAFMDWTVQSNSTDVEDFVSQGLQGIIKPASGQRITGNLSAAAQNPRGAVLDNSIRPNVTSVALEYIKEQGQNLPLGTSQAILKGADEISAMLEPVVQRNPGYLQGSDVRILLGNEIKKALAAKTPVERTRIMGDALDGLELTFSSMGVKLPLAKKIWGNLPEKVKQVRSSVGTRRNADAVGTSMTDSGYESLMDISNVMKGKGKKAYSPVERKLQEFDTQKQDLIGFIRDFQSKAPNKLRAHATVDDMLTKMEAAGYVNKVEVEKILKEWAMPAEERARKAYRESTIESAIAKGFKAKTFEGTREALHVKFKPDAKQSAQWAKSYDRMMAMFRETSLLTPRYLAANVLDMSVKTLIETGPEGLLGTFPLGGRSPMEKAAKMGVSEEASGVAAEAERALSSRTEFAGEGFQSSLRIAGNSTGISNVSEFWRSVNYAVESSFRRSAWFTGLAWFAENRVMPRLDTISREMAEGYGIKPAAIENILDEMRANRLEVSAEDVAAIALKHTEGNVEYASELSRLWKQGLDEASEYGVQESNRVHFPIGDERKIESLLQLNRIFTFHYWATRNIPYYVDVLAKNPWMLRTWVHYNQISEEHKEQMGLTSRFSGKLPGFGIDFLEGFLGQEATAYFNPMSIISFYDQIKPSAELQDDAGALDVGEYALGKTGISLSPFLTLGEYLLGGESMGGEPPRFVRHSQTVGDVSEALTGVRLDVEAPTSDIFRRARIGEDNTISGSEALDYRIQNRITELALEYGYTPDAPQVQAARGDTENPLYQRARQDVVRDRALRNVWNMILPFSMSTLGDTEGSIRQRQAEVRQLPQEAQDLLKARGDLSGSYDGQPQDGREAQMDSYQGTLDVMGRPNRAWMPEYYEDLYLRYPAQQQYEAWRNAQPEGADTQQAAYLRKQWYQEWLNWRRQQPSGADTSQAAFFVQRYSRGQ